MIDQKYLSQLPVLISEIHSNAQFCMCILFSKFTQSGVYKYIINDLHHLCFSEIFEKLQVSSHDNE